MSICLERQWHAHHGLVYEGAAQCLWMCSPILEWRSFPQFLQMKAGASCCGNNVDFCPALSPLPIARPSSPHSSACLPWQAASSRWGLLLCLPNLSWCGRPSSPTCTRPWSIRLVYQQAYDLLPANRTACLWGFAQLPGCRHGQANTNITWWLEWTC